jgi:hypothetical protein
MGEVSSCSTKSASRSAKTGRNPTKSSEKPPEGAFKPARIRLNYEPDARKSTD